LRNSIAVAPFIIGHLVRGPARQPSMCSVKD
jgi:hypothetical protein